MAYVGFRIELSQRLVKSNIKKIAQKYNVKQNNFKILDIYINGKIIVGRMGDDMLIARGAKESNIKTSKRINFSVLVFAEDKKVERIIKIVNVLGNGRIIRERNKIFVDGYSILNNLPEFSGLVDAFKEIETKIPGFIDNGWYYAPEVIFDG